MQARSTFWLVSSRELREGVPVKALFLILTCSLWLPAGAEGLPSGTNDGQLILTQLVSAPFPHPKRADGHKYKEEVFSARDHYSDNTVAIYIPRHFRPGKGLDFIVYFHGWKNNVTNTLAQYQLIEQLVESHCNAILVVPEGPRDASDSFGGKLEDPGGFKRFMSEVVQTLREKSTLKDRSLDVGNIILSGHSGGYQVVSSILDHGGLTANIREVWLFDALYGQTDKFLAWLDKSNGRLVNIYTENGGTKKETERMMDQLRQKNVSVLAMREKGISLDALRSNVPVFLFTELSHNDVVAGHRTFRDFCRTSSLAENAE